MPETATKYAVFDLDGTLADNGHRIHLITGSGKKDYEQFHQQCFLDEPIEGTIEIARAVKSYSKAEIIILTGRSEAVRHITNAWFNRWHIPWDHLIMREAGDNTPDINLKQRIGESVIGFQNIIFAVEDRKREAHSQRL